MLEGQTRQVSEMKQERRILSAKAPGPDLDMPAKEPVLSKVEGRMPEQDDQALQEGQRALDTAITRLKERYNGGILSVVLFGSFARGKRDYDDIDLLIVTANSLASVHDMTRKLAEEVFGPLFWEYGALFSPLVYDESQFDRLRDFLPLFQEIKNEGILLYGRDIFAETPG